MKPRKDILKQRRRIAEQFRIGDTARIKRIEHNASRCMVARVKLAAHHHGAKFAVFVGFSSFKIAAINHGDRCFKAGLKPSKLPKFSGAGIGIRRPNSSELAVTVPSVIKRGAFAALRSTISK